MSDIEKNLQIAAPIEKVWAALTDPSAIGSWMGDESVEVELSVGGRYALFDGETTGAFTRIEPPNVLEYTWRQGGWRKDWPDSLVRWELQSAGEGGQARTQARLTHSRFPNTEERDSHDEGWDVYWLEPMKEWLEAKA